MDKIRVFSTLLFGPPADVIAQLISGSRARTSVGFNDDWRSMVLEKRGVRVELVDRTAAEGDALLEAIRDAQQTLVTLAPRPSAQVFRLHRMIGRSRHVIEVRGIDAADPDQRSFAFNLARMMSGVVQHNAGFVDDEARWIIDAAGQGDPHAQLPVVPEAAARRARTIASLAREGVAIPPGLALVDSEPEALLASVPQLITRVLSLYRTYRVVCGGPEVAVEMDPEAREFVEEDLTSDERAAMAAPAEGARVFAAAGLESAWALLFVLGFVESMDRGKPCDGSAFVSVLDRLPEVTDWSDLELRPLEEILDQLDVHQCLQWLALEKRGRRESMPGGLSAFVIEARLRALRYAVLDQWAQWEEVSVAA